VLKVLAAPLRSATSRKGDNTTEYSLADSKRSERVFVSVLEMPLFCELLIEKGGGVREVARLFEINSGLVTMARSGYYAPGFVQALNITGSPPRARWITELDIDLDVRNRLEQCQMLLGIPRKDMTTKMVILLERELALEGVL